MSAASLAMLVRLMIAQVQECVFEKVLLLLPEGDFTGHLQVAQEAARVSDVYALVLQSMSQSLLKDYVPFSWATMVQVKVEHFRALSHYYAAVALCNHAESTEHDDGAGERALLQFHVREPEGVCLSDLLKDPEERRKLGKAHLRRAIIRHEEAMRIHGLCKILRKMDILQEVLSLTHKRSLHMYSEIDHEDDFFETAEAPNIHSKTQQKPDIKTPDFCSVRVTDIFHRLGPLSVFSAKNRWGSQRHVHLVRGEGGLGLTLRGDSPVLIAGVVPGGCAAEAGLREGDYIVSVNGTDCKWAKHAEVVQTLKTCSERGVELSVITLLTPEVLGQPERKAALMSLSGDKENSLQRNPGGTRGRGSLLTWNRKKSGGGASKRLGSTFSLPFGNLRDSESMY
ncbi:hypothetical protein MATL_G00033100 [Megalops atlanticus]|uniref:Rhophilin-1 n=1 Tax=Megalops atlanticus TaxID=7932 RepID=A0A9D3QGR6_MEGAT|nr:hypothetical protein MATL_G00033100 [Megalops atlanticus]